MDKDYFDIDIDPFCVFPRYLLKLPGINLGYLKVFEYLFRIWSCPNPSIDRVFSFKQVRLETGLNKKQILKALLFFEENGELVIKKEEGSIYYMRPTPEEARLYRENKM